MASLPIATETFRYKKLVRGSSVELDTSRYLRARNKFHEVENFDLKETQAEKHRNHSIQSDLSSGDHVWISGLTYLVIHETILPWRPRGSVKNL